MPKYYCDYCDTYLTHDSPSVRKTHCIGRKHRDNVKFYYQKWMEEQAQHLIDATTAAFKAGKIAQNPFSNPPPNMTAVPPPTGFGPPRMMPPPGMPPMMPPGMMPPGMRPGMPGAMPGGPMRMPLTGMRPPMMAAPPPQLNQGPPNDES
ncbi:U1 small nuclear ribonucleoprotein C-like [Contarinia nasturtii]|uniref:U1 small nuclear ribonucleoprotein C-like n=1 Tax=Contarinia nasturtii TaxID=265458 RepID=UPI0012D43BE6|nr:U1 small nuclear ribonucleoprotein C-like [Contarinia nasturtii]